MIKTTVISSILLGGLLCSDLCAAVLPCLGSQPLSGLVSLGSTGCTIGDKLFTGFTLATTGTLAALDATAINVLTSTTPEGNEVLTFTGGLTAVGGANGGTLTGIIDYTVSTLSGAALIEDLTLSMGPLSSLGNGPNSATATEYACLAVNVTCDKNNADFTLSTVPDGTSHLVFPPVSSLSVAKQITINATALNLVTVGSLTNQVSQIPEPGTWLTLVSGLALAAARRVRRSR